MAVIAKTADPIGLLNAIHEAFDDDSTRPKTWLRDKYKEFTHSPQQWRDEAWFGAVKPKKGDRDLKFRFLTYIKDDRTKPGEALYPYYHGRFIEMLIVYFSEYIDELVVTPEPSDIDDLEE